MGFADRAKENRVTKYLKTILGILRFPIQKGLGRSLLLLFLAISIIPLGLVSYISYRSAYNALYHNAINTLSTVSELKTELVKDYFSDRITNLTLQAHLTSNKRFIGQLRDAYDERGIPLEEFVGSELWGRITEKHDRALRINAITYGYDDIYFIDFEGNILYTMTGDNDLGTNIFTGKYADTHFGSACRKSFDTGKPVYSDMAFYEPLFNDIAAFIVQSMVDESGKKLGLIASRISILPIYKIMQENVKVGKTGDVFLIGSDLTMRTDSRFVGEFSVLKTKVDTELSRKWLGELEKRPLRSTEDRKAGIEGEGVEKKILAGERRKDPSTTSIYTNTRNIRVLGAYESIEIGGVNLAVISEINADEAFGPAYNLRKIVVTLVIVTLFIVLLFSVGITRHIVTPLIRLSRWARKVAVGDHAIEEIEAPHNELGELSDSFSEVVHSIQSVTEVCESISIGNFKKSIEVRSDRDLLGKSVNRMIENLRAVVRQANLIADGDYSIELTPHSEEDELGTTLLHMTETLQTMTSENEKENWIKSGKTDLSDLVRGEQDIGSLCKNIIGFLATYLDAQIGAIYLLRDEDTLKLTGSYAYTKRKNLSSEYKIGEGLVGQAALEKEKIMISDVPEDYIKIESGLGDGVPRNILVAPFLFEGAVKGVLELGSFHEFNEIQLEFLQQVLENIAINLNSSESRNRMNELLEQYQVQSERLQAQQEELRQINEELEEQTRALKESEGRLQNQQEELQQANEELEERTQALEGQRDEIKKNNAELEMAQKVIQGKAKELELSNKYKSEFLANMSHELRTPLNSIIVLSQLLSDNKSGNLDEKQVEFAQTVHSSANDLLSLINEILDLSKVEAGKMEIHIEEMGLDDFITGMERMFNPVADRKGINFVAERDSSLPSSIRTDRQKTEQIIKNLISNAFKFTDHGMVTLSIGRPENEIDFSRRGLDPGKSVSFAVTDSGVGISKEKQDIIFEAFTQADGTTSRKYGGTGLGLTICKELAGLLGGDMHLQSEMGTGTTFTLILPEQLAVPEKEETVMAVEMVDTPPPPSEMKREAPSPEPGRKDGINMYQGDKTILIIEDDTTFANILSDLAREKGFKCLVTDNGEKGLQLAEFYRPGAIILDIGLPGIDGFSVMDRLRENPKTSHIPVHFISGSDRKVDAMRMGAIGFLLKPVSAENLSQAFKKIEKFISKPVKNLLVAVGDKDAKDTIVDKAGNGNIDLTWASTGTEAFDQLKSGQFDAVMLDLGIEDMPGFELLSRVRDDEALGQIPFIVYANRDLTGEEEEKLYGYMENIPIQWASSSERLLDEAALFLHQVRSEVTDEKDRTPKIIHDKGSALKEKKVLLVDDDMRNIFALSSVLEDIGLEIIAGKNGREGLLRLDENPDVDIVLMDIMMPEMDGYVAMKEIRKNDAYKNLPIIALTAKAMKGDRQKCIEAGANDYLSKPVDIDKLVSLIRVYIYH